MEKPPSIRKFIFEVLRPFKFWIILLLIMGVIWAIDLSLRPYILKTIIDKIHNFSGHGAVSLLMIPASLYIGSSLLKFIVFRVFDFIWINLNGPLKRSIGEKLMERMMLHSQTLLQENFSGALGAKIKDVMSGIPDLVKLTIINFISHILALLIAAFTAWQVSPKFAFALIIWVLFFMVGSLLFSRRATYLSEVSDEVRSKVMGNIIDVLSNMANVRLFSQKSFESTQLKNSLDSYVTANQKRDWYFFGMFTYQGLSFILYQGLCLVWLIYDLEANLVTVGHFALILTLNLSIVDCLWRISEDLGKTSELLGNITQGLRLTLSPIEIQDRPDALPLEVSQGAITFDHVHFQYKGAPKLFQNKSVVINAGQKVGLIGYSGSGKSTFVNLILRFFEVNSGCILIDGQDIRDITQNSLREAIGMIPQDPSLFHRTLMENIRYGRLEATDQDVIEASKKAHAHDFIQALSEGYDSLVGERGVKLSGGQRQRIAIARAILKDAPILILDEATSQLDSLTEKEIQESLWNLMQGKTTVVIAHRLSTLLHMDRILVFDQGKIIQDGSHPELLAHDGLYKILWDTQVGGFLPS